MPTESPAQSSLTSPVTPCTIITLAKVVENGRDGMTMREGCEGCDLCDVSMDVGVLIRARSRWSLVSSTQVRIGESATVLIDSRRRIQRDITMGIAVAKGVLHY